MGKRVSKNKKNQRLIAKIRINQLFIRAEYCAFSGKINLANRYVEIARKISMRYLVNIPNRFKRNFCKHCYSYLLPDSTCRIRIKHGRIVIYCFKCKKYTRIPIKN